MGFGAAPVCSETFVMAEDPKASAVGKNVIARPLGPEHGPQRAGIIWVFNLLARWLCIERSDTYTSSTAQGGGGSFKNRKPIGEVGCCESGMAERSHWWTERCLISLTLSISFSDYLPTYLSIFYVSIYLSIYLSISLSFSSNYPIYLSIYLSPSLSLSISLSSV